jgi:hypothetical protein
MSSNEGCPLSLLQGIFREILCERVWLIRRNHGSPTRESRGDGPCQPLQREIKGLGQDPDVVEVLHPAVSASCSRWVGSPAIRHIGLAPALELMSDSALSARRPCLALGLMTPQWSLIRGLVFIKAGTHPSNHIERNCQLLFSIRARKMIGLLGPPLCKLRKKRPSLECQFDKLRPLIALACYDSYEVLVHHFVNDFLNTLAHQSAVARNL